MIRRVLRRVEYLIKSLVLTILPLDANFVMVTGADKSHYKSLLQLLGSVTAWEPVIRILVYDLGLEKDQKADLAASFPSAEIRGFDFSKYPEFFNITINSGEFAWKPAIFSEVFLENRGCVCWFDAGNVVTGPLTQIRKVARWTGFYSPFSKGTVADWTHPATLAYLKADESIRQRPNLTGGCVVANYRFSKVRLLVERWHDCAFVKECIAPKGSTRNNHRQDMSILTILAYQIGVSLFLSPFRPGFKLQQDID